MRLRSGGVSRHVAGLGLIVTALLAASGCGLGAGKAPSAVGLLVTREFGARVVRSWGAPQARGQETAMSLLTRNATVSTRFGGGFVQSIDGLAGGQSGGHPVDWFYYVNGIEAPKGAASTNVNAGDHIWWDWHDWSATDDIPAVVGSFPQPFLNGIGGKRLPVRVECANVGAYACRTVTARLRAQKVPAAVAALGAGVGASKTLRVAVGSWRQIAGVSDVAELRAGPRASGVFATFSPSGTTLTLLDANAHAAQTLTAGGGLVAATRTGEDAPVWAVTGTDAAGVDRAAGAFDQATLAHRFAVAVSAGGALALPRPGA
ncbi:MAG TPA: DUF4430 domain-containing protein [Solirubrobacteraceae bacterium]|nr:DUF4430 domain-containing protein [Solirubrobacteraceae bacterium]